MVEIKNLDGKVIYHNEEIDTLEGVNLEGVNLEGANLRNANLRNANLKGANLRNANLKGANLSEANLSEANLIGVNFICADLIGADLISADLRYANLRNACLISDCLRWANLQFADFYSASLKNADLRDSDLTYTDLSYVDLTYARLSGANIEEVKYNNGTLFFALQCPEEGSFIAWKKVNDKYIIKLKIPADAERSSATSRKCRCSKAKVLGIYNVDKELLDMNEVINSNHIETIYKVGKMIYPDSWDADRWEECSHGIHFFMTFDEAKNY